MASQSSSKCSICDEIRRAGTVKKRIIICCDGTDNASDKGVTATATNVGRLSRVCANVGHSHDGAELPQIVYYQSGVGTGKMSTLSSLYQSGLGDGLDEKVCEAYNYIANNYGPEDEILIFGFSRGAYTARALASFLCQVGLLVPSMMDYFADIWALYKARGKGGQFNDFEDSAWAQQPIREGELGARNQDIQSPPQTRLQYLNVWAHSHVKVKVVGVWDTVGSLGVSGYQDQPGTDVTYQSSTLHWKIENAFHAIALDETRGNFAPTLYYLDNDTRQKAQQNGVKIRLRQCWFPGYHGDIGGHSNAPDDTNSTDEITFAWMIDQLERYGLLQFSRQSLEYPMLDRAHKPQTNNGAQPPKTPAEVMARRILWSDGTLNNSNGGFWYLASAIATRRYQYTRQPGKYYAFDENRPVSVADFNETIHPCVWHRMQTLKKYKPAGFSQADWTREALPEAKGFEWVCRSQGNEQVRLKEYVIPDIPKRDTKGKDLWTESLERRFVPKEYLHELDKQNAALSAEEIEEFF